MHGSAYSQSWLTYLTLNQWTVKCTNLCNIEHLQSYRDINRQTWFDDLVHWKPCLLGYETYDTKDDQASVDTCQVVDNRYHHYFSKNDTCEHFTLFFENKYHNYWFKMETCILKRARFHKINIAKKREHKVYFCHTRYLVLHVYVYVQ